MLNDRGARLDTSADYIDVFLLCIPTFFFFYFPDRNTFTYWLIVKEVGVGGGSCFYQFGNLNSNMLLNPKSNFSKILFIFQLFMVSLWP